MCTLGTRLLLGGSTRMILILRTAVEAVSRFWIFLWGVWAKILRFRRKLRLTTFWLMFCGSMFGVWATLDLSGSENFMLRALSQSSESWILSNDPFLISVRFFFPNICFTIISGIGRVNNTDSRIISGIKIYFTKYHTQPNQKQC